MPYIYIKLKRDRFGTCNICLQVNKLTWDHVPPKSGIQLASVEIDNILKVITSKTEPRKIYSQNGVKYRTICHHCNSLLGSEYDKELNSLNRTVSLFLKSTLKIPSYTYIRIKPIRLIKAILGHLLAAKLTIDSSLFDNTARGYFLSDTVPLPDNVNIFYWAYPHNCTIILRDFVMPAKRGDFSKFMICHVLKYFPLAFLISDVSSYHGLPNLSNFRGLALEDEIDLRIDLKRIEPLDWPDRVDDENMIFVSKETANGIIAQPHKSK